MNDHPRQDSAYCLLLPINPLRRETAAGDLYCCDVKTSFLHILTNIFHILARYVDVFKMFMGLFL
ncbi:hypothetical protein KsCSTR_46710 [Candidatus Kuenenia stuttgartiensis]|uniref:Uncharacterized protein n=1 Tax=Kuenenia stuttgartiensis TaxID=174633 RepID=Q1PW62_KUEST|nr:hypothetical protein KsCSTR_46710 [Candidatus Kuenenia stuttgartiensis]CAJ71465.1 unknown protein [Candidatus Kuenenia stuttgartiensis]